MSENPEDFTKDKSWTAYRATTVNGKKSYTIKLSEGRNIIQIKTSKATTYHVILARGLDVKIDNVYRPGQSLSVGDTAKITIDNMIPPMFKMAAIYNPSGVQFTCKTNGVDYTTGFGQYMAGSSFIIKLQDEDAGTYKITDGALTTSAWGTTDGAHRRLTRNSMSGYWNGGDNPNINYGKMAYIPEISFDVTANEDSEETTNRSAGLLKSLVANVWDDEMSMVDVMLFHSLLKAVAKGTRLVMVGDVDQLPSVGPGNVLRDLVNSDVIPVIRLNEIFRQAGRSRIVTNAHLINRGEMPVLDNIDEENDFLFYECPTADIALSSVLNLCGDYAYLGKINELQVLSPMKGNMLGVVNLNTLLQAELNPAADDKAEFKFGEITFREGDRVMQIKNNYDIQWRKTKLGADDSEGEGVFNGDIGTILRVDNASKFITVLFDDERVADYNFNQLEDKSQGSEFPCVVLPLVNGPNMLFNRNILYTAVTRARSKVYILGSVGCIKYMVSNTNVRRRYSALETFLRERNETLPDV